MAAAAIAGGIFGAVTSYFSTKAKNKALVAQAEFNIQKNRMTQNLANYAQSNNLQKAVEIGRQISAEEAEAQRGISVQERKAVGEETIRRGEGLTAGASAVRSVDDVIAQGNAAKAKTASAAETAKVNVLTQTRQANANEQMKKISSHQNTLISNAQLAAQQVTGLGAVMQIAGQAMQGAQAGASLGSSLGGGNASGKTPAGGI